MTRRGCLLMLLLLAASARPVVAQERSRSGDVHASAIVGAPTGLPRTGDELDRMTKDVASLLRCPVCQGSSAWDSPATMAVNMKRQVRELLADGYDRQQVLEYFKTSYGDFVLLAPAKNGIALLVWLLPAALLFIGGVVVWRSVARGPMSTDQSRGIAEMSATDPPGHERLPADPDLARYVQAVRTLAYGDTTPGHVETELSTER